MKLAIIQSLPSCPEHVIRTDSFAKFQDLCGLIEQSSYLAAHAACHASMNGMSRILAVHAPISQLDGLITALDSIFKAGPWDALVIPGLTDFIFQKEIAAHCLKFSDHFDFKLFLDPPKSATPAEIVDHQKSLPRFACFAWPWISTVTHGRRSPEWLPPSCVIAPLALGCTDHLRGVHELDKISSSDAHILRNHDVEVLVNKTIQRRPVIGLFPHESSHSTQPLKSDFVEIPLPNTEPSFSDENAVAQNAFEIEITQKLHQRCDELIQMYPKNDASLWSALERTAISILSDAKMRGQILKYHVRCDEETASWGTKEAPVVEVLIEYPKRVKEIHFRMK